MTTDVQDELGVDWRDQQMESWLRAHVHAFEHFGAIPALAVPDNTKTGVTKAHRYDPDLNPTCNKLQRPRRLRR